MNYARFRCTGPKVCLLLICVGLLQAAFGQQMPARLVLINGSNGLPVTNATVHNRDFSFARTSDENGVLTLIGLPSAQDTLWISSVGFEKKMVIPRLLSADGLVLLATSAGSLAEVVVNAAGNKGVFHSISDLDIHIRPITNSQEVLRMVPGLFIGQHAGGGKAEQIFLRGFDIDHGTDIRISVDGMPVNMVSHAHGQGYADLHFVIPELIERVNFDKGPYFASQGNFATAGYVDFQTRHYLNRSFVKLEGGQFGTYRAVAAINLLSEKMRRKQQSLYAAGEVSRTQGYFDSPQDFTRYNALLKYHGELDQRTHLTVLASAFSSSWDASGQIPDRAVKTGLIGWYGAIDDREGGSTSRYNVTASLQYYLSPKATLRSQVYYSRYAFELFSNFTFFLNDPVNGDQIRQKESRDLTGWELKYEQEHRIGSLAATLEAGTQWRHDRTFHSELSRTRNRSELLDPVMLGDVTETNGALYVQDRWVLHPKWNLTVGVRADQFWNRYLDRLSDTIGEAKSFIVSPKLNLQFRASQQLQFYLNNGQGLHSNDTRVAVQQDGREVVTPARGSDLGVVYKPNRRFLIQSALWYLWLKQEFVYVGDEGVVEAGGKTQRMGWDFSARYELAVRWYADVDLSLARPRALGEPRGQSYLPLAPSFTSTGGISYRQAAGWNGSLRYRYMAARPANEDNSVRAASYFIIDAAVNYTRPRWELGLAVQNVLDRKWKETQFDTESRLQGEPGPVSEIHFTPGTPFFARLSFSYLF